MSGEHCARCRKPAELGLQSGKHRLWYCIACARHLGQVLDAPHVLAAADDAARRKRLS